MNYSLEPSFPKEMFLALDTDRTGVEIGGLGAGTMLTDPASAFGQKQAHRRTTKYVEIDFT